ncbi:MAG: dockerin type I repeat-containing protein [Candidatus Binatia bacterium]
MGKGFATTFVTCFSVLLGMAAVAALPAGAGSRAVAVPVTGACCNSPNGCCPGAGGNCFETSSDMCFVGFQGNGTNCAEQCTGTTTTTLPTGACCHPNGSCTEGSSGDCGESNYQGDGTECAFVECTQPTTTTTVPQNLGACCLLAGGCMELTLINCTGVGAFQGDGTDCNEVLCFIPTTTLADTTTTIPDTTTTVPDATTTLPPETTTTMLVPVPICGDANGDLDVTAADALAALKTAVGTSMCPLVRCDYNGSGEVTAPDALLILKVAVGQVIVPMCPVLN